MFRVASGVVGRFGWRSAAGIGRIAPPLRVAAFVLAALPLALLAWKFQFVCDDAFISFRYARNLAEGHGLVFNPGVDQPVEGYSELGWVLLMALGLREGLDPVVLSRVLSALAGLALVALSLRLVESASGGRPLAYLSGALFLAGLPPLAVWWSGGLATMPFTLALVVCFSALHLDPRRARIWAASLAAVLLVLLRADGAFWVACVTAPAIALGFARGQRGRAVAGLVAAGAGALVFFSQMAWRLAYYGDWLPNTARVKLGLSERALERGFDYVAHFGLTFPGVLVALAAPLVLVRAWRRPAVGMSIAIALATAAYAVLVGGDFMAFGRFLVPALPFIAVAWAGSARELVRLPRVGPALALSATLVAAAANLLPAFGRHPIPEPWRAAHHFRHNTSSFRSELAQWRRMHMQARAWIDLGKALAKHVHPDDSLVFGAVGAIGYYSGLFIYDKNGLVTREVAMREPLETPRSPGHDKTVEQSYFLKDSPTWLDAFLKPTDSSLPPGYNVNHYLSIVLEEDYDLVKRGDLLLLQPGPGYVPR